MPTPPDDGFVSVYEVHLRKFINPGTGEVRWEGRLPDLPAVSHGPTAQAALHALHPIIPSIYAETLRNGQN